MLRPPLDNPLTLPVFLIIGMFVFVVIALRLGLEAAFLYFPEASVEADPGLVQLEFENVFFTTADGERLHGWFVPGPRPGVLVWFHGNAGNIGHRVDNLRLLHDHVGVNVFLFDYRGYGQSQGKPSEAGLYEDAEAALRFLRVEKGIPQEEIVYFGRSLGAAVAVDLATKHRPCGLILEGAFPSLPFMARTAYPFLPVWPFLKSQYDIEKKLPQITAPLLMLHGEQDTTVPIEGARRIFDAATNPKAFYLVPGAHHNNTYLVGGQEYFATMRRFLDEVCK